MRSKDMFTAIAIEELRGQIEHFCGLGDRVIDQARRRVLFGEQVATDEKIYSIFEPHTDLIKRGKVRTDEKIYSIFEPHTDLIKRGKVRTPVEFGHKVFLAESAEGLITQYEVLKGNPPDEVHVASSLQRHRQAFGRSGAVWLGSRLLQ
jgi:IS5 family transposase